MENSKCAFCEDTGTVTDTSGKEWPCPQKCDRIFYVNKWKTSDSWSANEFFELIDPMWHWMYKKERKPQNL